MLIHRRIRLLTLILMTMCICDTASGQEAWSTWWRGCTPEALTDCLRKSAGTAKAVALGMNFECRVRFDRGFRFDIFIDGSAASLRPWSERDRGNYATFGFKGHRAGLAIKKSLLLDQATGEQIDGDFRKRVSDKTNSHIFNTANALLASKGICEPDFALPKLNGVPKQADAAPRNAPGADRGPGSAEDLLKSTTRRLVAQEPSDPIATPSIHADAPLPGFEHSDTDAATGGNQRATTLSSSEPIVDTRLPYDEQWRNLAGILRNRLAPQRAMSQTAPLAEIEALLSFSPDQLREAKAVARQLEGDFIWGDLSQAQKGQEADSRVGRLTGLFVHNRSNATVARLVLRSTSGECDSDGKQTHFLVSLGSAEPLQPSEAAFFVTELHYPAGFFKQNENQDTWCTEVVRAF